MFKVFSIFVFIYLLNLLPLNVLSISIFIYLLNLLPLNVFMQADTLTQNKDILERETLQAMITLVTDMLNNITMPRSVGSHFPADLNTANQVTNNVISILRESIVEAVPLPLNVVN